ncbi:MAG TPA: hypothetical protein VMY37_28460 [Thermoguttaceae bacterium]|nr:hypothetical protein [Thermoguttaceae bacterium]
MGTHRDPAVVGMLRRAEELDKHWSEFFRSKNPEPLRKIIATLALLESQGTFDLASFSVGQAAAWSLGSVASQKPEVLSILKAELPCWTGFVGSELGKIIAGVEGGGKGVESSTSAPKPPRKRGWLSRIFGGS